MKTMRIGKKLSTIFSVISLLAITGCTAAPTETIVEQRAPTYKFEHPNFTLELPHPFTATQDRIIPQNTGDFSPIIYSIVPQTSSNRTVQNLIANEETLQKNLCGQSDACSFQTDHQQLTINGMNAVKFTNLFAGIAQDRPEGTTKQFNYSIIAGENIISLRTNITSEQSTQLETVFDKIAESTIMQS